MDAAPSPSQSEVEQQPRGEFQNVPQSLMGIWYMKAFGSGFAVIDHIEHGIGSRDLKEFALMSLIFVVSTYKALYSLEDYIESRRENTPMPVRAPIDSAVLLENER
ncbi:MAG TPA: hypothetical protein VFH99_02450 [Candidatus Saccharimonadales bacterium]|nr:hypothetical protein [Candidatus Saccharimonadales bacterium]